MKFDFNDVLIQPIGESDIRSRSEINPYVYQDTLPIITAPMDTVISKDNYQLFSNNKIVPCLPRGEYISGGEEGMFQSYSLSNFKYIVSTYGLVEFGWYLIDIANGHMTDLLETTRKVKEEFPNITLMVGNVANPETYKNLSDAGADYIRVGIGNGGGCLTTQQTGVGYPMGSLVLDCYNTSLVLDEPAKIVADGGMQNYSDVIKALGLGADYVMLGSILNKTLESAGANYWKGIPIDNWMAKWMYNNNFQVTKKFRGMSTKEVQKKWGNHNLKTSEGVTRYRNVEYTIEGWVDNFEHYLRSAMSYSDARTLYEFREKVKFVEISNNAYKRFNK